MAPTRAAVGFRVHTGWAAACIVTSPPPAVGLRRRVALADTDDTLANEVYHRAVTEGAGVVRAAKAAARRHARRALAGLREEVPGLEAAAVILGNTAVPARLSDILASHALIHAAEGRLYAEALASEAERAGLRVTTPTVRELAVVTAPRGALSRPAGPPWGRDQREAAAAAWLALGARRGTGQV